MCLSHKTLCHLFVCIILADNLFLDLTGPNNTLLRCTVNVTSHPGFVLSILPNGQKPQGIGSHPGNHSTDLPCVSLSDTLRVEGYGGKYECQLHLNKHLIASRSFDSLMAKYFPPLTGKDFIHGNFIVLAKCQTKKCYGYINIMINT